MAGRSLVLLPHKPTVAPDQSVCVLRVKWQTFYVEREAPALETELPLLRIPTPRSSCGRCLRKKSHQVAVLSRDSLFGVFSEVSAISVQVQGKQRNAIGHYEVRAIPDAEVASVRAGWSGDRGFSRLSRDAQRRKADK